MYNALSQKSKSVPKTPVNNKKSKIISTYGGGSKNLQKKTSNSSNSNQSK